MEEKRIGIIPFSGERDKWRIWSGKFLARAGQLGYDIILRGTAKKPTENLEENTKGDAILKKLKKNAYNDLILAQDDTVCFQIVE